MPIKRWFLAGLVLLGCALSAAGQSLRRTPVVRVVERVRPAVVNLTAEQVVTRSSRTPFDDLFGSVFPEFSSPDRRQVTARSLGSGVVISPDGLVITNEHVIEGASEITVRFASGATAKAEVIGSDAESDLALLRVPGHDLPHLQVAARDDLMIGETMIAIGNPLGLENTVTVGVLSARDRTVQSPRTRRVYTDFLQTDASINPGNSGGALVDLDGRLVGINTAIVGDAQGIGFAIPARRVRRVVRDLLRFGEVQPSWLGMFVRTRQDRAVGQGATGVEVVDVFPGSPAARAGIVAGDVLAEGDGRRLTSREDYATVLAGLAPGEQVAFRLATAQGERAVTLRAVRPPADVGEQILLRSVGIALAGRRGNLAVVRVRAGSPAAETGLARGDEVLRVNGEPAGSLADVNRILARDHTRSSILLVVRRGPFAYNLTFPLVS